MPGVFVLGSNDYFKPRLKNPFRYLCEDDHKRLSTGAHLPTERLVASLTAGGWTDLNNARGQLAVGGAQLEFVGVDDPHLNYDRYHLVAGPADPSATLTIGVTHAPYQRTLDAMTADGAGLVIAGHTHGGQLCLPFVGALVTNCDLDRGRAKGVSRWWPGAGQPRRAPRRPPDAAYLEVSAGLGTSPYGAGAVRLPAGGDAADSHSAGSRPGRGGCGGRSSRSAAVSVCCLGRSPGRSAAATGCGAAW